MKIITRDILEHVIERVAGGESVRQITSADDAPCCQRGFYYAILRHPDLGAKFDVARAARSQSVVDEAEELAEKVARGEIAPQAGKVAIDFKLWLAERADPRRFGNRQETTVSEGKSNYVADLERAQGMIKRAEPLPTNVVGLKKATDAA